METELPRQARPAEPAPEGNWSLPVPEPVGGVQPARTDIAGCELEPEFGLEPKLGS